MAALVYTEVNSIQYNTVDSHNFSIISDSIKKLWFNGQEEIPTATYFEKICPIYSSRFSAYTLYVHSICLYDPKKEIRWLKFIFAIDFYIFFNVKNLLEMHLEAKALLTTRITNSMCLSERMCTCTWHAFLTP